MANSLFQMGSCASDNKQVMTKTKHTIQTTVVRSFRSSKNCTFKVKLKPIQPIRKDDVFEDIPQPSQNMIGPEAAGIRSPEQTAYVSFKNLDKKVSFVDNKNRKQKGRLVSSKSHDISCDSQSEEIVSQSKSLCAQTPLQQCVEELFGNIDRLMGRSPNDQKIIKAANGTRPVKLPKVQLKDNSTYEGECLNGQREGFGMHVWPDGTFYEGGWRDNKVYGYGVLKRLDGDYYEGYWKDNRFDGKGTNYNQRKGCKYIGVWHRGKLEGKGRQEWSDGAYFEGMYKNGKKSGSGKLVFADGSYYDGNFCQNEIDGFGKYCWLNSRTYEGEWSRNQMQGRGKISYNNGTYYQGEFYQDKRHGHGVYVWADGRKYIGNWQKGKQHGRGVMYSAKGQKREGQWCQGKKILQVTR